MPTTPKIPGLVKGLGVTLKTMVRTLTKGSHTVQYPRVKEAPTPRARGADAARDIASAGVGLAKSRYRPQAFAFGSYNANRDNALPTDTRNRDRSVGERRLCRFGACLFGRDVTAERRQRLCPHLEQRAAAEPNSVAAGCPSRSPPNRCSIGRGVTRAMSFPP